MIFMELGQHLTVHNKDGLSGFQTQQFCSQDSLIESKLQALCSSKKIQIIKNWSFSDMFITYKYVMLHGNMGSHAFFPTAKKLVIS